LSNGLAASAPETIGSSGTPKSVARTRTAEPGRRSNGTQEMEMVLTPDSSGEPGGDASQGDGAAARRRRERGVRDLAASALAGPRRGRADVKQWRSQDSRVGYSHLLTQKNVQ